MSKATKAKKSNDKGVKRVKLADELKRIKEERHKKVVNTSNKILKIIMDFYEETGLEIERINVGFFDSDEYSPYVRIVIDDGEEEDDDDDDEDEDEGGYEDYEGYPSPFSKKSKKRENYKRKKGKVKPL